MKYLISARVNKAHYIEELEEILNNSEYMVYQQGGCLHIMVEKDVKMTEWTYNVRQKVFNDLHNLGIVCDSIIGGWVQ